jgi:hypothetical protein
MDDDEKKKVNSDFSDAVNMTPTQIEKWLSTDDSKRVGQKSNGGGESVGHESGRKIISIKNKKQSDLTEHDYEHMRKVVGYVNRHLAQGPSKDKEHSDWRYSLMNWGHDPLKKG